jgi:hypothetical protein
LNGRHESPKNNIHFAYEPRGRGFDSCQPHHLAFAGTELDWMRLAGGDLLVKAAMAVLLLAPYRALLPRLQTWSPAR